MSFFKKISLAGIIAIVGFVSVVGSLGFPEPAKATIPVVVTTDVVATTFKIKDEILEGLKIAVQAAAGTVVSYVLRKVAYDSAVWLASGGKGQSAFAQTKSFGDYLKNVGNDAVGHGIEELSKGAGFNLCSIPDPKLDLAMKVGLRVNLPGGSTSDPTRKPACSFTDFQKNWSAEAWRSKFSTTAGSIEQQFNSAFKVDETGLGIQLAATSKINEQAARAVGAADSERIANQGFVDKKTNISGDIQTPAPLLAEEFKANGNAKQVEKSGDKISDAINSGNYKNLPGALANFFLSTLAGTVLKNFQQKGVLPFGLCIGGVGGETCVQSNSSVTSYADSGVSGGRRVAEQLFSGFLAVHTSTVNEYDILGQLSSCPDAAGLYNCRADAGLVQAAQEIGNGNPTTIQEAMDKGWLHPDFKLIPPNRAEDNSNKNCYNSAYCYSNIKVLRQARILPLGFELAAAKSDPDQPWTLSQVVKGFNDCNYIKDQQGTVVGVNYDPIAKPFCHLIDPDWVIKSPPGRCNALGFGPNLLSSDAPDRLEDCADLSTCVAFNSDGTCNNYGYCAREKNSWRFAADSCSAQFRTCRSFVDATGAQRAYVYRSLDTSVCTKENVGCATYSLSQDGSGNWQDPVGPNAAAGYVNNGIYFNNKVSTSCSANSAGCSAFQLASNTGTNVYLKKAPEYLGCYDSDPATPKTDWPDTVADLARLTPKAACNQYAGACIPDEVSCNWYTPASGGGRIPGRFKAAEVIDKQIVWNDQCDAKCVGYSSYREMPGNYSVGQDVAYIIPASGSTCTAQEEGCSGFTNLSTTLGQVENVEYFSYLRACVTPDPNVQKNFITYEGSTIGGYQLKVFTLAKDETGGPKYFYRTEADAQNYDKQCSEALYKAGKADADCRQFNDDAGNIYYRLLAKTIPVSSSCTPYRLNNGELLTTTYDQTTCAAKKGLWSNNQCQVCLQGGEYKNGSCFYYGLPGGVNNTAGNSRSCQASANTCRAYKGNAGNNIREVFNDTFESSVASVLAPWKPASVTLSSESTRVGEHSLGYIGATALTRDVTLTQTKSYDLTFWAKGDGQSLAVSLASSDGTYSKDFGTLGVGDTWNYYHVGPIEFGGATQSALLTFKNQGTAKLYLDNVRLVEVTSYIYLVKNSLKVDAVCDATPSDNLPGEALGCMEYKDPSNKKFTLTGFNYLCREGAIGCTALFDTQNTPADAGPKAYNVWLTGVGGAKAEVVLGADTFSCQVPVGQQGCYVTINNHTAAEIIQVAGAGAFVKSTVYIPGDTPRETPVYLVANQAASCNVADLGCMYAGVQKATPTGLQYTNTLVKNDPANYQNTLCQREAVGCMAFASDSGDSYFKDPVVTGQKICSYVSDTTVNGNKASGWFWKGVGVCSNNKGQFCSANADCGTGNTCQSVGSQPCYPNYVQQGNSYGLWSYGDGAKYENFVGECPVAQDKCTQFVDHNDGDKSYYFLKNEKISAGVCDGSVSQKKGCALFDQADNPNKYWSSAATYAASSKVQDALVKPIDGTANLPADANIIIKVDQDRVCGEWLQCRSSHRVWDDKAAKWKVVCDDIGRCNRAPETTEEGNITNCASWIEGDGPDSGQVLTPETYVQRDTSWAGMDYTGWSIPGIFPIEELTQFNISAKASQPDFRLVHRIACGTTNCVNPAAPNDSSCKENDKPCGTAGRGVCQNGLCVQNPDGTTADLVKNAPSEICRTYPEKDSPFPNTSAIGKAASLFSNAKFCGETNGFTSDVSLATACECNYTKVTYGDGALTKYWNYDRPNSGDANAVPGSTKSVVPSGICQGGFNDGHACTDDGGCQMDGKTPGTCQIRKRTDQLLGWKGFCLEGDTSRTINANSGNFPCLSWFPVDTVVGANDINEQHPEAGYQTPADIGGDSGKYYCLAGNVSGGPGVTDPAMNFMKSYPENRNYRQFNQDLLFGTVNSKNEATFGVRNRHCENFPVTDDAGTFSRDRIYPSNTNINIRQQDIEKIVFQINGLPDSKDVPALGAIYEIWPNDPTTGAPQAVYVGKDHNRDPGIAVTGRYMGHSNEFVLMYASNKDKDNKNIGQYLDKTGNVCVGNGGLTNDLCVYAGDENGGNCSSLSGNILTGPLVSRHNLGSRYNAGKARDQVTSNQASMGYDGIWDASFSNREICDSHAGNGGSWHAIRVKFNNQTNSPDYGKFIGYDVAYCSNDFGATYRFTDQLISYKVTFQLREWCSTVADTSTNGPEDTKAVAWTNRLWKNSQYVMRSGPKFGDQGYPGLGFDYTMPVAPFGSLQSTQLPANDPFILTPFDGKKSVGGDMNVESCSSGGFSSCSYTESVVKGKPATPLFTPGVPYSCVGDNAACVRSDSSGKIYSVTNILKSLAEAKDSLGDLFARVSVGSVFNRETNKYIPDQPNIDKTAVGDWQKKPRPPVIFPVGTCDAEGHCLEDGRKPGMTVNGVENGKDALYFTSTAKVILKFFMAADADQMPIREVNVFWGDGQSTQPGKQSGPNYRGYEQPVCKITTGTTGTCVVNELQDQSCSTNTDCTNVFGAGSTCLLPNDPQTPVGKCVASRDLKTTCKFNADCAKIEPICAPEASAPSFGRIIDKTCTPNYKVFDNVYSCTRNSVDNQGKSVFREAAECPSNFPNGCCIFVPKVQVVDNWGWCNGTCKTEAGGGCYNDPKGIAQCVQAGSTVASTPFANRIILAAPVLK